ncbi:MAG: hypothetical protein Q620_VSAC00898G0001, partial [Veillonella sp. DORA_A_3_16_22]
KTKRISVTLTSNSRQAYKIAQAELQNKIDLATNTDIAKDMTLNDVVSEYLESKRAFRKSSTQYSMDNLHKQIMKWFPADILLSKLSPYIIQSTFDKFACQYSYNYTKLALSLIRQSLKYARRMEYIRDISFLDNIELQKPVADV